MVLASLSILFEFILVTLITTRCITQSWQLMKDLPVDLKTFSDFQKITLIHLFSL